MTDATRTVAITGGTGFVGRYVMKRLLNDNYKVRALVRNASRLTINDPRITPIHGDLFDDGAITRLVRNVEVVIHIVGIIMERPNRGQTFERVHALGVQRLLDAARDAGVKRWIHMSALGARPAAASNYHRTKWQGEQAVRESGLDYTIFRPSIIHGYDGEFMQMVKSFWCDFVPPFVPYFGKDTAGKLQPVWVEDVASVFYGALTNTKSIGETYPVGGPDEYTWPRLYSTCRQYFPGAKNKRIVAIPVAIARFMARMPGAPFNDDQVTMSQENSVCDTSKLETDFGITPAAFEPTLADYAGKI